MADQGSKKGPKLASSRGTFATSATLLMRLKPGAPAREMAWKGFYGASQEFEYDPSKGRFRGYLKTCTLRALIKRRGREAKFRGASLEDVDPQSPDVHALWERAWGDEVLRRGLELVRNRYAISPERRRTYQAFEEYALKERPQQDVARELGMSVDSVHQAKHRVTRALRSAVKELDETLGREG
jgi:DNA-directed RNA polymerase specialized sigma24 family protein